MSFEELANLKIAAELLNKASDDLMDFSERVSYDSPIGQCVGRELDELASEAFDLFSKVSRIIAMADAHQGSDLF